MNWLFRKRTNSIAPPPAKVARPTYPFQVILLVENLESLTLSEKELAEEINTATAKYDIPVTIREYNLFHPDDAEHVKYLPSYHIYKKSKWKSTHSASGNVEKRLCYWIRNYETALMKQLSNHPQQS